jgi:hypothetical protein
MTCVSCCHICSSYSVQIPSWRIFARCFLQQFLCITSTFGRVMHPYWHPGACGQNFADRSDCNCLDSSPENSQLSHAHSLHDTLPHQVIFTAKHVGPEGCNVPCNVPTPCQVYPAIQLPYIYERLQLRCWNMSLVPNKHVPFQQRVSFPHRSENLPKPKLCICLQGCLHATIL